MIAFLSLSNFDILTIIFHKRNRLFNLFKFNSRHCLSHKQTKGDTLFGAH